MEELLRFQVRPEMREAPLVLAFRGWNDAGEAATSVLSYLDTAVRAVPLAEIDGEEFLDYTIERPTVRIDAGGARVVDWPKTTFRYGSADPARELVLGVGAEPHMRWRLYTDLVSQLVRELEVRQVVLLGAFVADVLYSRPVGVTGFATKPEALERLGVVPSGYEGPTGILGVLGERLRCDGVDVVSLWAGLPHYIPATPNPRGALALLQKITACLGIAVDEEPLRSEAAAFEQRIAALVASDPDLEEYVRQLKRREFAQ